MLLDVSLFDIYRLEYDFSSFQNQLHSVNFMALYIAYKGLASMPARPHTHIQCTSDATCMRLWASIFMMRFRKWCTLQSKHHSPCI